MPPGRDGVRDRFFLFLDEFQEYITHDVASMLDQVRKGGLHLVLSHQHLDQLGDDDALQSSIATNARIKAVFGGLDYASATVIAQEIRLKSINRRRVTRQIHGNTVLSHYVQTVANRGTSFSDTESTTASSADSRSGGYDEDDDPTETGWGEARTAATTSGTTSSESLTESRILIPVHGKELKSEQAATLQDKVAAEAYEIMTLKTARAISQAAAVERGQLVAGSRCRGTRSGRAPDR